MRIAIDYTAAVRQRAGIGRYTRSLIRALAQLDAESCYVLFVPSDARRAIAQNAHPTRGVRWCVAEHGRIDDTSLLGAGTFPNNFRLARAPLAERALVTLWQRLQAPLPIEIFVGAHEVFYSPDFVLPPTRARRKIVTIHDLSFLRVPETAVPNLKWYLEGAVPRAVRRADLILADSNATRCDLIELLNVPPDRVRTLYAGCADFFQPVTDAPTLARVRQTYTLDQPFILSVGTLEPRKNLVRLIQAFAGLPERHAVQLLIVGGRGWMYDQIYAAPAKYGVADRVRFLGFVPDQDLPALYSLAELFVYPSLYEGFGLPVLEALACGAVVIASNNSSLPEVAGDAAVLVDARDTEAWTWAMSRMLNDTTRRQMLKRRALEQAKKFSWQASARQLRAAFET